jgi:hypothetical protein
MLLLLHARDAAARPPRTNIQTFLFLFRGKKNAQTELVTDYLKRSRVTKNKVKKKLNQGSSYQP